MTIEARLIGDWAEAYPRKGHLALILPLALDGAATIKAMRLRVEGIPTPLRWVGLWDGASVVGSPLTASVAARCVFVGAGQHQPAYHVTLEGKIGWAWQTWGEFELRPGVARYVMRPSKAKTP
jgi:hypothetical protein